jgi:hypothetical protein
MPHAVQNGLLGLNRDAILHLVSVVKDPTKIKTVYSFLFFGNSGSNHFFSDYWHL